MFRPILFLALALFPAALLSADQGDSPLFGKTDPAKYMEVPLCHLGAGTIKLMGIIGGDHYVTNFRGVGTAEIPPGASIGEHVHRTMEEMFFALNLPAEFTVNGHTALLPPGSLVVCRKNSSHGIYNPSPDKSLHWLNIGVSMEKEKYDSVDFDKDLAHATVESPAPFLWTMLDPRLLAPVEHMNGGKGTTLWRRMYGPGAFVTNWEYIDHIVLAPGASIGYHRHDETEEAYYIISGMGRVTVNGVTRNVGPGDAIPCTLHDSHGIYNNSGMHLQLFATATALKKGQEKVVDLGDDLTGK